MRKAKRKELLNQLLEELGVPKRKCSKGYLTREQLLESISLVQTQKKKIQFLTEELESK